MITITVIIIADKFRLSILFLKFFKNFLRNFLGGDFLSFEPLFDFTFTRACDIIRKINWDLSRMFVRTHSPVVLTHFFQKWALHE